MTLTLAAVGAVVAALLQSTVVPYLRIAGATPDLLLVYVVIVTVVIGIDHGLAAAFAGGIVIDSLGLRPFGSSAFVLLLAAGAASLIARLAPGRILTALAAVVVLALITPAVALVVYGALRSPVSAPNPLGPLLANVAYSFVVALVAVPVALRVHRRFFERERIDW